jgi:hypothetical protein
MQPFFQPAVQNSPVNKKKALYVDNRVVIIILQNSIYCLSYSLQKRGRNWTMWRMAFLLTVIALIFLACEENNIANYYAPQLGGIQGQLIPADSAIITLSGDTDFTYQVPSSGRFYISDIPPGDYSVIIEPFNYTRVVYAGIAIGAGSIVNYGTISLNTLPFPLRSTFPAPNDTTVDLDRVIVLQCQMPLNLDDLNAFTTITPDVEGQWYAPTTSGYYYFGVESEGKIQNLLLPSTEYRIEIEDDVRIESGGTLEGDVEFTFSTKPITVSIYVSDGNDGLVSLKELDLDVNLGLCVSSEAFISSISIDPPVEGIWISEEVCYSNPFRIGNPSQFFSFFPFQSTLPPATQYTVRIAAGTSLIQSAGLRYERTFTFTTEPYRVVEVSPPNGSVITYGRVVELHFNTAMDTLSVEQAFSLVGLEGENVTGEMNWHYENSLFTFDFRGTELSDSTYVIRLLPNTRAVDGSALEDEIESYFRVTSW